MTYEDELAIIIAKWLNKNQELREINKYLYEHTELFEKKYEKDYQTDLWKCFANKICRYTLDEKKIYENCSETLRRKIRIERL